MHRFAFWNRCIRTYHARSAYAPEQLSWIKLPALLAAVAEPRPHAEACNHHCPASCFRNAADIPIFCAILIDCDGIAEIPLRRGTPDSAALNAVRIDIGFFADERARPMVADLATHINDRHVQVGKLRNRADLSCRGSLIEARLLRSHAVAVPAIGALSVGQFDLDPAPHRHFVIDVE